MPSKNRYVTDFETKKDIKILILSLEINPSKNDINHSCRNDLQIYKKKETMIRKLLQLQNKTMRISSFKPNG